jgi:hypothetical protein
MLLETSAKAEGKRDQTVGGEKGSVETMLSRDQENMARKRFGGLPDRSPFSTSFFSFLTFYCLFLLAKQTSREGRSAGDARRGAESGTKQIGSFSLFSFPFFGLLFLFFDFLSFFPCQSRKQ